MTPAEIRPTEFGVHAAPITTPVPRSGRGELDDLFELVAAVDGRTMIAGSSAGRPVRVPVRLLPAGERLDPGREYVVVVQADDHTGRRARGVIAVATFTIGRELVAYPDASGTAARWHVHHPGHVRHPATAGVAP